VDINSITFYFKARGLISIHFDREATLGSWGKHLSIACEGKTKETVSRCPVTEPSGSIQTSSQQFDNKAWKSPDVRLTLFLLH
jgi:hypothetical protein